MKKYIALTHFEDLEDESTVYELGTIYPRSGVEVSDKRIALLLSKFNNQGKPVVAELKELPAKKKKLAKKK